VGVGGRLLDIMSKHVDPQKIEEFGVVLVTTSTWCIYTTHSDSDKMSATHGVLINSWDFESSLEVGVQLGVIYALFLFFF
jgi:hypothetical protein